MELQTKINVPLTVPFDSINFKVLRQKLELVHTISSKQFPNEISLVAFDLILGVQGIVMQFNHASEHTFSHLSTPPISATGKILLGVFSGNKSVEFSNKNEPTIYVKNATVACSETQKFQFTVPTGYKGYISFFLISESWHLKYTRLSELQLPRYSNQTVMDAPKLADSLKKVVSDKLKEAGIISELFYGSAAKLTEDANQDGIDTLKITQVADFLKENIKQTQPTLIALAELASMSVSSLKVKFKEHYGVSVKIFFVNEKMQYARSLLEQGKRIKEVAALLGYKAPQSFSNAFHRTQGSPPSNIKKIKPTKEHDTDII